MGIFSTGLLAWRAPQGRLTISSTTMVHQTPWVVGGLQVDLLLVHSKIKHAAAVIVIYQLYMYPPSTVTQSDEQEPRAREAYQSGK